MSVRMFALKIAALFAATVIPACLWPSRVAAQSSSPVLTFTQFAAQVEANHPVAQQAKLTKAQADASLREAWGAFDPKFSLGVSQKAYKGDPYYTYLDAALKVPTPLGADLKLGFERARGTKLSTDRTTPSAGLLSLGVTVPIGQRMLTDERRTALSVARAQQTVGSAESRALVNKLLLEAAKVYGAWYSSARRAQIAADGVRLAEFRLSAVVQRVQSGESAPIDTLEASLEVQRRAVTLAEANTELTAAQLVASSFLWDAHGAPIELAANAKPALEGLERTPADTTQLARWIVEGLARHPELQKAEGKLRASDAERALAWQAQLPFVEASVSSIADRSQSSYLLDSDRWGDNYKAGLDVQSSLLLMKERAKASRSAQKTEFARLDRDRIRRDLVYGLRIALNDVVLLERLLSVQRANLAAASTLRDAEQQRFLNGESTLLTVNLRERLVLDEAVKLASLEGKLASARGALVVAVGDPTLVP